MDYGQKLHDFKNKLRLKRILHSLFELVIEYIYIIIFIY